MLSKVRAIFSRGDQMSRGKMLLHNTAALSIGRLGSKVLVFLLIRFYTGVLTDAQYGTADLITNLANLLIPLACAGLSSGFFRFVEEKYPCALFRLEVEPENEKALRVYTRAGFDTLTYMEMKK